jgi:hypothetical protein
MILFTNFHNANWNMIPTIPDEHHMSMNSSITHSCQNSHLFLRQTGHPFMLQAATHSYFKPATYLYRLAFQTARARIRRRFRLEITANESRSVLTLSANELAIDGAGSHSMAAGSR